jgi:hypothetical protein
MIGCCLHGRVARPDRGELSLRQEVEGRKAMDLLERQETLLAVTGQVGDPLYSNTREVVLTLKCPIRGIDTRWSIRWICTISMMEGNDRYEMGYQTDQTGMISDAYTDIQ